MADGRVPIPFLRSKNLNRTIIVRSAIVSCVENIRAVEKESKLRVSQGRQTAKQAATTEKVHRDHVKRLAQLSHQHGQLCYSFEHSELLFDRLAALEDPTCRRALRLCFEELEALQLPSEFIHPEVDHPAVIHLINNWFTPAFTLSKEEFHQQLWLRSCLPDLAKSGKYIDPRAWNYAPTPIDDYSTFAGTTVTTTSHAAKWEELADTIASSYHNAAKWEIGDADTIVSSATKWHDTKFA
jgi:hypothetical protein